MAKLGETLSTQHVEVEGEGPAPLGGVVTTKNIRIHDGSYERLGQILSTVELWAEEEEGMLVRRQAGCAEIFLPAAPAVVVTSGAAPWVPGDWVSLGAHGEILVPSYVHVAAFNPPGGLSDFAIETAYGDAKTPLDAAREMIPLFNPGETTVVSLSLSMMCQPIAIPADEVVYARAAGSNSASSEFEVFLVGWSGGLPAFDTIPVAAITGPGRWYPANYGADYILMTSGAGWVYGSSATVIDPAPNDMLVVGIEMVNLLEYLLNNARVYQIGYGPNLSEIWCATLTMGRTWTTRWVWPPVLVKSGERLAIHAADGTATTNVVRVKVYDL